MRKYSRNWISIFILLIFGIVTASCWSSQSGGGKINFPTKRLLSTTIENIPVTRIISSSQTSSLEEKIPALDTLPPHTPTVENPYIGNIITPTLSPYTITDTLTPGQAPPGWIVFASYGVSSGIDIIHTSGKGWRRIFTNTTRPGLQEETKLLLYPFVKEIILIIST